MPIHIIAPFKVYGKRNIKRKQNYIIACNHLTYFDPLLLDFVFSKRNRYLAKQELYQKSSSRFWLGKVFGGIPIDRSKGLTPSQIKTINSVLSTKQNLGIFVDGTRKEFEANNDIKGGACYFAIRNKKPIIPCYIVNKQKFFRKNHILVGSPIYFEEFYDKKITKEVLSIAEQLLKEKIYALKTEHENYLKERKIVKQLKRNKNSTPADIT